MTADFEQLFHNYNQVFESHLFSKAFILGKSIKVIVQQEQDTTFDIGGQFSLTRLTADIFYDSLLSVFGSEFQLIDLVNQDLIIEFTGRKYIIRSAQLLSDTVSCILEDAGYISSEELNQLKQDNEVADETQEDDNQSSNQEIS